MRIDRVARSLPRGESRVVLFFSPAARGDARYSLSVSIPPVFPVFEGAAAGFLSGSHFLLLPAARRISEWPIFCARGLWRCTRIDFGPYLLGLFGEERLRGSGGTLNVFFNGGGFLLVRKWVLVFWQRVRWGRVFLLKFADEWRTKNFQWKILCACTIHNTLKW